MHKGEVVEPSTEEPTLSSSGRRSSHLPHGLVSMGLIAGIVAIVMIGAIAAVSVLHHRQAPPQTRQLGSVAVRAVAQPVEPTTTDPVTSDHPLLGRVVTGNGDGRGDLAAVASSPSEPPAQRSTRSSAPPMTTYHSSSVRSYAHDSALADAPLTDVPLGWSASTHDLISGNLLRSYIMIRPPVRPAISLPVVIMLHGRGLTPTLMERISHVLPVLGQAIAVFPAGWGRSWNAGGCCGVAHREGIDDVAFLNEVLHQVLATQPDASPRRVYLVGYSNGGRMAMRMACAEPGMFAGLAAVEAVPVAPCGGTVPLPTVLIDSTGDPLLTIATDGPKKTMQGYLEPTVGATVDEWRQLNGCTDAGTASTTGTVTSTVWSSCRGQGRLEYDLYQGGSHHWPAGDALTPSAESLISRFLFDAPSAAAAN